MKSTDVTAKTFPPIKERTITSSFFNKKRKGGWVVRVGVGIECMVGVEGGEGPYSRV